MTRTIVGVIGLLFLSSCGGTAGLATDSMSTTIARPAAEGPSEEDSSSQGEESIEERLAAEESIEERLAAEESIEERLAALEKLLLEVWQAILEATGIFEDLADSLVGNGADSLASHMPVVDLDTAVNRDKRTLNGIRHIGPDVAPLPAGTTCDRTGVDRFGQPATVSNARWCEVPLPDHTLNRIGQHGKATVFHGTIKDGVGREKVVAWLQELARKAQGRRFPGLPIHPKPLTVRIAEGTTEKQAEYVLTAVQVVNASLPIEWKLTISDEPARGGRDSPPEWPVPAGEVHVRFDAAADSGRYSLSTGRDGSSLVHTGGLIWMSRDIYPYGASRLFGTATELDYEQTNVGILVHELLHAMGFLGHPDMVSILSYDEELSGWAGLPGHAIYPLDREGLLAAYTRLTTGVAPENIAQELGPWSDTSTHVMGEIGLPGDVGLAFGAAVRNGFSQPWAYGPAPEINLSANPALTGSASWSGRLLGLTPQVETVAGAADLTVGLATLDGTLDFTALESWGANAAPGEIGTGVTWGDGTLGYSIEVGGNTFIQTGGDVGTVTGGFFGKAHEGMGGTLDREDLAAGFGGTRTPQ